jgi:hypothetical protein
MVTEEDFLDQEDYNEQQDNLEDQGEQVESVEWAEVPQKRKQDSLYTLFQKVWKAPDSSKVANLSMPELGRPLISVRDAQYLDLLGKTFHHNKFGQFFKNSSEIVLSTSASKKGWFTELFVSQRKFTTRSISGSSYGADQQQAKKKWTLFGGSGPREAPEQQP